jgi:hypothetical protein
LQASKLKNEYFAWEQEYIQLFEFLEELLRETDYERFTHHLTLNLFPFITAARDLESGTNSLSLTRKNFGYKDSLLPDGNQILIPHTEQILRMRRGNLFKSFARSVHARYHVNILKYLGKVDFLASTNELIKSDTLYKCKSFSLIGCRTKNLNRDAEINTDLIMKVIEYLSNKVLSIKPNANLTSISNVTKYIFTQIKSDIDYLRKIRLRDGSRVLMSSGGNYFNTVATFLKENNNITINRYAHGGERCFFNDKYFWRYELSNIDEYISYNINWEAYIRNNYKYANNIKMRSVNSGHLRQITDNYTPHCPKQLNAINILVVGVSYVGEALQVHKISDHNQLKLEKKILRSLKNHNVKYRAHPKGLLNKGLLLEKGAEFELSVNDLVSDLSWADVVLVTYFGTFAVEATLAGKKIIYVDIGIRNVGDNFNDLTESISRLCLGDLSELPEQLQEILSRSVSHEPLTSVKKIFDKYYSSEQK